MKSPFNRSLKKRLCALALISGVAITAPALALFPNTVITVSPEKAITTNGGVFEGWGTSLCWWANRLGYSDTLAQLAADAVFGQDGLRLNIMRYNIGGGDEFVLLTGSKDEEEARHIAEDITEDNGQPILFGDTPIPVSMRYALTPLDTAIPNRAMIASLDWTL